MGPERQLSTTSPLGPRRSWRSAHLGGVRGRYITFLLASFCFGLALRILHAATVKYSNIGDLTAYLLHADLLTKTGAEGVRSTLFPPGYPAFIRLLSAIFGLSSLKPILYTQALLDAASILLLAGICRSLYGARTAVIAAIAYSVYRLAILSCGLTMSETLATFLALLSFWLVLFCARRPKLILIIAASLTTAAMIHVRTNFAVFAIVYAVALAQPVFAAIRQNTRPKWNDTRPSMLYGAFLMLFLVPWSIRNSLIEHKLTFLSTNSAMNLFQAHNAATEGGWPALEKLPKKVADRLNTVPQTEKNDFLRDSAKEFAGQHPAYELFFLVPRRLQLTLFTRQEYYPWDTEPGSTYASDPFGPKVKVPLIPYLAVLTVGLLGFVFVRGRKLFWMVPVLWFLLVLLLLGVHANPRFRMPFDFLLIAGGSAFLARWNHCQSFRQLTRFACLSILGWTLAATSINYLRFSGADLLAGDRVLSSSPQLIAMHSGRFSHTLSGSAARLPLGQLKVKPGMEPHLLFSFDFKIDTPEFSRATSPNILMTFLSEEGSTVTIPITPQTLIPRAAPLNRFYTRPASFSRKMLIPAMADTLVLDYVQNIPGTVEIWNFRVRGPVWSD